MPGSLDGCGPSSPRSHASAVAENAHDAAVEHVREQVRDVRTRSSPSCAAGCTPRTAPLALAAGIVLIALSPTLTTRVGSARLRRSPRCCCSPSRRSTTAATGRRSTWAFLRRLRPLQHLPADRRLLHAVRADPARRQRPRSACSSIVWSGAVARRRRSGCSGPTPRAGSTRRSTSRWAGWRSSTPDELRRAAATAVITLIAVGGGLYTLGGVVYGLKQPEPVPDLVRLPRGLPHLHDRGLHLPLRRRLDRDVPAALAEPALSQRGRLRRSGDRDARQTRSRQTYAAAGPSTRSRSASSGIVLAPASAATTTTRAGRVSRGPRAPARPRARARRTDDGHLDRARRARPRRRPATSRRTAGHASASRARRSSGLLGGVAVPARAGEGGVGEQRVHAPPSARWDWRCRTGRAGARSAPRRRRRCRGTRRRRRRSWSSTRVEQRAGAVQPDAVAGGAGQREERRRPRSRSPPAPRRARRRRRRGRPAAAGRPRTCTSAQELAAPRPPPRRTPARPAGRRRRTSAADRQAVPGGHHLVVPRRAAPGASRRQQPRPDAGLPALGVVGVPRSCRVEVPCSKVPRSVTPSSSAAQAPSSAPSTSTSWAGRPDVERALLRPRCPRPAPRRTPPSAVPQLVEQEVGGLAGDPAASRSSSSRPSGRRPEQLGVVVEHLLEVRHHPGAVDASSARSRRRAGRRCRRAPSPRSVRRGQSMRPRRVSGPWRSRNSSTIDGGNFGAPPKPPYSASKLGASCRHGRRRGPRRSNGGAAGQLDAGGQVTLDPRRPPAATSSPRSVHASSIASSSWRKLGCPCRGRSGK